ncbi:putative ATP-dependent RNA helicase ddx46, partial [Ameca splendens]
MGRESRHYRKRSASRGRSGSRSKSRSPDNKRSKKDDRDRSRRDRSRSRDRRRSRSRDRKRPRRSRSRERRRSRSRERKRSLSRSRTRRSRSGSPAKSKKTDEKAKGTEKETVEPVSEKKKVKEEKEDEKVEDQDFDQNKLEEEMRKRKERVEKWREEQRKKAIENIGEIKRELEEMKQGKKWSLEDDDDDDEEGPALMEGDDEDDGDGKEEGKDKDAEEVKKEEGEDEKETPMEQQAEEDEVDPLDAYMEEVKQEVKKFNIGPMKGNDKKGATTVSNVVTVVKTKKQPLMHKKKGELMENDQDAMEYSSEEEEVDLQTALTGFQTKQRKVLEPVDHAKIQYEPYRKNFYVEVPELAKMTTEEVNAYRLELEGIIVKGKGCPKPIKTWVQCGVSMKILNSLKRHGYEKPTPIQAQAIPAIMSGRDLIGIAKTGSGKTIAFLLPMFRHIMDQRPLEEAEGPISVIMTPTRELALQITKECKKFSKPLGLRVVCVYGGTGISEQ